jgi:hypothetical protein
MITNTGKNIIAKYLIGQTPAYASYIAIGCGALPLNTTDIPGGYGDQKSLEFETYRMPIISRGYINENGSTPQLVVTAELPTEERYEISEVGIYPAASDSVAGTADSKLLIKFTSNEAWTNSGATIPVIDGALDPTTSSTTNTIETTEIVFKANSDNSALESADRLNRQERPRFLNEAIFARGNFATLDVGDNPATGSSYFQLSGTTIDLSENSPEDLIKIAFSVLNKEGTSVDVPIRAKIVIDFIDSISASYARGKFLVGQGTDRTDVTFENRYIVASQSLGQLEYSSNDFNWKNVNQVKIYPVVEATDPELFYIALDAVRLDNLSSGNTLYGLVGYTVIKNSANVLGGSYPRPIVKDPNTSNFVEFRFNVGVQ